MKWNLRWRLSLLWFLEWGITGTVMTYMPVYLESIQISKTQQSHLYAVMAIGLWVAPFVVGQVADRYLAMEKLLAVSHFVGGLTLYFLAQAMELYDETQANFQSLIWLVGLFAVAYMPTVPLVSAMCFRHLTDPDGQFGKVRVWGTVGWMIGGVMLSFWLEQDLVLQWLGVNHPNWRAATFLPELFEKLPRPRNSDCFRIGAILSFALSSFCIFLPHTPPAKKPQGQVAPLAVLAMFKDPTVALFIGISCLLTILVVPLYNLAVPPMLTDRGVSANWVPVVMLIGQISEFPSLLLLALMLRRLGPKAVFALGIVAWIVRYLIFASQAPWSFVVLALSLHGVCHVFLAIVAQMYLDAQCSKDLRATAQNLLMFITLGIGMPLGTLLAGWLRESFHETPWKLFGVPALAAVLVLIVFWFTIRFPATLRQPASAEPAAPEPTPSPPASTGVATETT
ncbi:MAG: MFS transporter [Planctomycetes bacterium]|nr:MFS transporter [Planctomycetota bacterium]